MENRLPSVSAEQAFASLCILQGIETEQGEEQEALETACIALRYLIKRDESKKRKNELNLAYYYKQMHDPEYVRKKREKDKRYRETHKEQIREKNRRYREANYKKEIVS